MSEIAQDFERMFDTRGTWDYAFAFGLLMGLTRFYLRGELTRDRFTAGFAVIQMRLEAHNAEVEALHVAQVAASAGTAVPADEEEVSR